MDTSQFYEIETQKSSNFKMTFNNISIKHFLNSQKLPFFVLNITLTFSWTIKTLLMEKDNKS